LRKLLQASRLPHLRAFALRGYSLTNLLGTLTGCSALEQLTSLRLGLNYSGDADRALRAVLTSVPWAGLTELALDGAPYNSSPLAVVADSPLGGQLSSLTLDRGHCVTLPARPGPLLSSLRSLRLRGCVFLRQTIPNALLASPELANLMVLDLRETQFPAPPRPAPPRPSLRVEVLAHLSNLTTLLLADQRLGDANVVRLAAANLAHLTELNLSHNDLTSAGAIAESPYFTRLRKLTLRGNPLGPSGLLALLGAPFVPRLWWLDLWKTGVTDAIALELIDRAPSLPNLAWLDVRGNALSAAVRERLRAAFGPAVRYDAR
jgi:hypothetical protein